MAESSQIKLLEVRLSFPDIFKAKAVKGSDPKFAAHFLLDKEDHAGQIADLKKAIWEMAKEKWGEQAKEFLKKKKVAICLHEGSEKDYEGYDDKNMFVTCSSTKRPLVVDRDRTPLAEEDRRPYAGCYVNAVIRLWPQDNEFGKRINAELMGVQFVKDGEAFGAAPLSEDAFEDLDEGKKGAKKEKEPGGGKKEAGPANDEPDDDEVPF